MEEFVPRSQILKDLGGEENWSYQYIEPVTDENSKMKDSGTKERLLAGRERIVKEYEAVTVDWIDNNTGSEISEIKEKRHKLALALREDYWRLDPYVRARSVYDRVGMLQPGGKLEFYPKSTPTVPAATIGNQKVLTSAGDVD